MNADTYAKDIWPALPVTCPECDGARVLPCTNCEGKGTVLVFSDREWDAPCPICKCEKVKPCWRCHGAGVIT